LIVLYSLVIQAVSVGILVYSFTLFSLAWLDEFEASRRDVMITISCLQIGMGVLGPLVGRWLDLFPMRYVVLAGAAALIGGLWLAGQATHLWHLWVVYGTLMPIAAGMMGTLASQTLVAKWFVHERGLAMGLSAMGTNLGGMIFPLLIGGWLIDIGWRGTFEQLAIVSIVLVVPLTWLMLGRTPPQTLPTVSGGLSPGPSQLAARQWLTRDILTTSLFWLPFLALVPLNMTFGALQFNLANFARDAGLGDAAGAQFVTVGSLCMLIGKLFFGSLGDRLDHRILFWIANVFMIAALGLLLVGQGYTSLVSAVACMGLAGGGILPLMGVIFSARFGAASFGRVMGFVMLNVTLGALAPVAAGWVFDETGSYDLALYALLILIVPAMVAMARLPQPSQR